MRKWITLPSEKPILKLTIVDDENNPIENATVNITGGE